jgi:phosphatidate cytidylyltransferase
MSNILQRAITGALFVVLIIASILFGSYTTVGVFSAFLMLGLIEYFKLFKENKIVQLKWGMPVLVSILIYSLLLSSLFFKVDTKLVGALIIPILLLLMMTELWRKKTNPLVNLGIQLFGFFYLVIPFFLTVYIRSKDNEFGGYTLVGMYVLIWSNDTFAYLSGRFFGKTKLFERISPKKTWEGTIGGVILTLAIGLLIGYYDVERGAYFWLPAAMIVVPGAIFGDLLESLFKRSLNIKDSGNILPGHGGILDRFDAALFTIPFFFCWWTIWSLYFKQI